MITFIGFYNTDTNKILPRLCDDGFIEHYRSEKVRFLSNDRELSGKVSYFSNNGYALILVGEITNLKEVLKRNTDSLSTEERLKGLLDLFEDHGERSLDLLDGSFAMVVWDEKKQSLHFCRDDSGTKLLYYLQTGAGLIVSNNLKEILKFSGKKEISRKALVEYLRFLDISPPYTIFKDVYFLEPETVLSIDASGIKKRKKVESVPEGISGFSGRPGYFEQLFIESVEKRLQATEKTGVFLSGGIDSSLVCATAAHLQNDIRAITVGFEDPRFDESAIAKNVARHLKIDHEVFFFSMDQDLDAFHAFTSTIPSPFADPAIIPTFQCFRKIEAVLDNMLDGTGADTLIGIMPARHIHFILNFSQHVPFKIRSMIARTLSCSKYGQKHADLFDYEDPAELLIRWKGWEKNEINALTNLHYSIEHTMFHKLFRENKRKTPYEIYSCLMGALPDDRVNQSSAIAGVNVSFPFFDRKVQHYVRSLPVDSKYQKGKAKTLYREMLGKYVPSKIWNVPKHGFDYQFWKLMQHRNYELIETFLSRRELMAHGLFETSVVEKYVRQFKAGDHRLRFKIWGLLMFQGWYKNFLEKL